MEQNVMLKVELQDYQVMPPLSADEYAELKEDIRRRGVMVPIEYDENGNVLDGHHRLQICAELGITDFPKVIRAGLTEEQKRTHARKLNMARRQLNRDQKQELIRQQLVETPEKSDRQIASGLGISHHTVNAQRRELESTGQIAQLETNIGLDGIVEPTKPFFWSISTRASAACWKFFISFPSDTLAMLPSSAKVVTLSALMCSRL